MASTSTQLNKSISEEVDNRNLEENLEQNLSIQTSEQSTKLESLDVTENDYTTVDHDHKTLHDSLPAKSHPIQNQSFSSTRAEDSSSSSSSTSTSSSSATTTGSLCSLGQQQPTASSHRSLSTSPLHQNSESIKSTNVPINDLVINQSSHTIPAPSTSGRKNTMACEMCNNYEIQLQDIQYREAVLNLKIGQYDKTIKQLKEDLKKEQTFRGELEEKYVDESKRFETDIKVLSSQVDEGRSNVEKMTIKFNKMEKKANDLVSDLISQIEALKKEIQRLALDNEKLLGRHLKKSQEMSSESISLPGDLESLQFYCLQLRENLIQALYNREHLEESLRSENMFLKEQLLGEQQSRENIEENFSHENEILTSKVHTFESELNDTLKQNEEMKVELELVKNNFNDLSLTSSNRIKELEEKVAELSTIKTKSESDLASLRAKVQSLQVDLDNSEQVQRDFVKLSQSLQVQLEKIRQADTEVRWQHEEDVNECNGCKKTFHSRKEKINCLHCGRIFCLECCSKLIRSGPKMRTYKVCQVCHTLLDNQTACWFVNEAPQSPT
ncbi:rab gtpase-binding effector protein 1-like protein [Dermatophagoides farinae]|nr:rab gtpase-binding effector protein 1-like protein [Dermatophagoides farinae]